MKRIIPSIIIVCITALLGALLIINGAAKNEAYEIIPSRRFPNMLLKINETNVNFELYDNDTADAFYQKVKEANTLTLTLKENGGFEKYGDLGFSLPTNDESMTLTSGELAIYQGDKLCLFYGSNTYSYSKLGRIKFMTTNELKELLGEGDIEVEFKLEPTIILY